MPVEILDAKRDETAWKSILSRLPIVMQDMYFTPEYLALHRFEPDTKAVCFVYNDADQLWAYPFLLSTISTIGRKDIGGPWRDIDSAYGYGGPVASDANPGFLGDAHSAFQRWCKENKVIAEFVRLHPLIDNRRFLDPNVEQVLDRETRSLSLEGLTVKAPPFDKETQYMLRRAERGGIRVEALSPNDSFDPFLDLYFRAMDRLSADAYYYFDDHYFAGLREVLTASGLLLAAIQGERWVAAAAFLMGMQWLHYHLSATAPGIQAPGATNLILWHAAMVGAEKGLKRFHLGGGRSTKPSDSLLKFKKKMSTDSHLFYVGKRILQEGVYQTIRETWAQEFPELVDLYGGRVLCYHYRGQEKK